MTNPAAKPSSPTYVLFFSGPETRSEGDTLPGDSHSGSFEILVRAPDVEAAQAAARQRIVCARKAKEDWVRDFAPGLYLERILELVDVPDTAQVVNYRSCTHQGGLSWIDAPVVESLEGVAVYTDEPDLPDDWEESLGAAGGELNVDRDDVPLWMDFAESADGVE
jgi:hypothetical protein